MGVTRGLELPGADAVKTLEGAALPVGRRVCKGPQLELFQGPRWMPPDTVAVGDPEVRNEGELLPVLL